MATYYLYNRTLHRLEKDKTGKLIKADFPNAPGAWEVPGNYPSCEWRGVDFDVDGTGKISQFDERVHKRGEPEIVFEEGTGKILRIFPILRK